MYKLKFSHFGWMFAFVALTACKTPKGTVSEKPLSQNQELVQNQVKDEGSEATLSPEFQPLPLDPAVIHGTLPNGMQYFIRKNTKPEKRMELRLAVNAGSIQEDDDQKGLAHFLEHMAFNGSENFKQNDLIHYVESVGVQFGPHLNAYTSFDETVYMLQVPTDKSEIIDTALLIMEDWAKGLTLPVEEIEKEKGVVLSEWRSSLGPQQRMQYKFFPTLFQGSRYPDRLPIGDTSTIAGANQELLNRFYEDWYRPDLMAIILVGDFDAKEMEKEVIRRFSDLPKSNDPREKELYPVPPHKETLVQVVTDKEAPYTQVIIFEKHPASDNNSVMGYRNLIKNRIVNTILNERFKEILQQPEPPFFVAVSNYGKQLRTLDAFATIGIGTSDKVEDILKTLYEEQFRAERHGFTQGEFDRAISIITANYETALNEKDKTESAKYASEYVEFYLDNQTTPGIDMEYQLLSILGPTISLAEINKDVKKMISHKNSVVVITAPEKDKALLPSEERVLEIKSEVELSELAPKVEEEVASELLTELPEAGKIVSIEKDEENNIEIWKLSNGAKVFVKPTDFKNDEILIEAFSRGGSSLYSDDQFFSASNAAPLMNESGFGDFDAVSLSRALSGKNIQSTPFISSLEEGLTASSTPKDLETLMQLIYLNFTAPRKDTNAFNSYVSKSKSMYSNLLANPAVYFQKVIYETLYSNNIRRSFPKSEDFDKINLDQAYQVYQERFKNAADFQIVIVGNTEDVQLKRLVEQYIASLPSNKTPKENWKDNKITLAKGKVNNEFEMGSAPKTNALYTYSGVQGKWDREEEVLFNVLTSVLNIKLREALREDKGGVYGVGVQGQYIRVPSPEFYILITYNVDPDNAEDIENEAMKVIEAFKAENVEESTLSKVKEKIKRNTELSLKENSYWVSAVRESATYNEAVENADDYLKMVQSITPQQIKEAAHKFLKGDNFIRIVMNPEEEK